MSFSTSYAHVGDTTGYTSNKGVWAKAMFHQKRGPFTKKRKKWYQNFGGDPAFYKISEREEDDVVKLPQIIAPEPSPSVPVIETTPRQTSVAGDKTAGIPEIVVEECQQELTVPATREEKMQPNTSFLMPPKQKRNKPLFGRKVPEAAVYDGSYGSKQLEDVPETNCKVQRYLASPKYTHLRVPRRHVLITHVSQESIDSPFVFPKIDTETTCRKPVTVTFTKSVNMGKGSVRRKWNFRSLNEPIQIYTRPESASSTTSDISPVADSPESHRKTDSGEGHAVKLVHRDRNNNLATIGAIGAAGADRKCGVGSSKDGAISVGAKARRKWVLPEHWPSQDSGLGQ